MFDQSTDEKLKSKAAERVRVLAVAQQAGGVQERADEVEVGWVEALRNPPEHQRWVKASTQPYKSHSRRDSFSSPSTTNRIIAGAMWS